MVKWGSVYILLYLFLSYQIYGTLSHVKLSVMLNSNLHFALISIVYTTLQQYVSKFVGDLWFSLSFKLHQIIENDGLRVCDFRLSLQSCGTLSDEKLSIVLCTYSKLPDFVQTIPYFLEVVVWESLLILMCFSFIVRVKDFIRA